MELLGSTQIGISTGQIPFTYPFNKINNDKTYCSNNFLHHVEFANEEEVSRVTDIQRPQLCRREPTLCHVICDIVT